MKSALFAFVLGVIAFGFEARAGVISDISEMTGIKPSEEFSVEELEEFLAGKNSLAVQKRDCRAEGQAAFEACCDAAPTRCKGENNEYQVCNNRGNRAERDCKEAVERDRQRKMIEDLLEWIRRLLEGLREIFAN